MHAFLLATRCRQMTPGNVGIRIHLAFNKNSPARHQIVSQIDKDTCGSTAGNLRDMAPGTGQITNQVSSTRVLHRKAFHCGSSASQEFLEETSEKIACVRTCDKFTNRGTICRMYQIGEYVGVGDNYSHHRHWPRQYGSHTNRERSKLRL